MSQTSFTPEFVDALDRLFQLRRDVRRFRAAPVAEPLKRAVFASLATAPSVGLSQPWRIVFFDSAAARAAARGAFERANAEALTAQAAEDADLYARLKLEGMDKAPVQFAVFVEEDPAQGRGLGRRSMPETARYSAVCAVMQLWLAARARGLGLGWISILDAAAVTAAARAPEAWRLIGYFCLGWPEDPEAARPELEKEGWERRAEGESWFSAV